MNSIKARNTSSPLPVIALVACPYDFDDYISRQDIAVDDLGLGYLYEALTNRGYSVILIDSLRPKNPFIPLYLETEKAILAAAPNYVGFSDSSINFEFSLQLSKRLKETIPGLTVIYGDMHASIYREEILKEEPHIDFIICGDGDRSLPRLIEALEEKSEYSDIPGLTYRDNGEIKANPPDLSVDFDTLPFPYRPSLKDPEQNKNLFFNLITSKGCNGHCTYCSISSYLTKYCTGKGERWRSRSVQNIVSEIKFLYNKGVRNFFFFDDNLIGNPEIGIKRLTDLCDSIIEQRLKDVSFSAAIRPDSLLITDEGIILKMKQSGFHMLSIGMEASNEKQLRLYGKQYSVEAARKMVAMLFKHNIMVRIGYIMFFPYSTFEMLKLNADFLADTGLAFMFPSYFSKLFPIATIPLEKKLKEDNLVRRDTTYRKPGIYSFQDSRIGKLQKFMENAMSRQHKNIYSILKNGFVISKNDSPKNEPFRSLYFDSLDHIAEASASLFDMALTYFKSVPEQEIRHVELDSYKEEWQEIIKEQVWVQEDLLVQMQKRD